MTEKLARIRHILQDCNHVPEQQKRAQDQPYGRFLTPKGYGQAQSSNSQSYDSSSEEEEEHRGSKKSLDDGKQKNVSRELSDAVSSPTKKKQMGSLEVSNKMQAVSSQSQALNARRLQVKKGSEQREENWKSKEENGRITLTETKKLSEGGCSTSFVSTRSVEPKCQGGMKEQVICAISHSEADKALFGDFEVVIQSGVGLDSQRGIQAGKEPKGVQTKAGRSWKRLARESGSNNSSHDQTTSRVQIGEKRKGEPVMEEEDSKHKKVDEGKSNEIAMYESVVGLEMLAHHEK
ncbi:unnamed protein product [Prunus armeniaca]|uniref:Uncharacterized protein n=1 Tax=Prunus armeniaca TaxID=36596 RepID=A0A6J5WJ53_PRUAR|nr:unnamed protein product [Prunus armeniaca]CAB4301720.1 unnamed protein product [Prunus armeniaca]